MARSLHDLSPRISSGAGSRAEVDDADFGVICFVELDCAEPMPGGFCWPGWVEPRSDGCLWLECGGTMPDGGAGSPCALSVLSRDTHAATRA